MCWISYYYFVIFLHTKIRSLSCRERLQGANIQQKLEVENNLKPKNAFTPYFIGYFLYRGDGGGFGGDCHNRPISEAHSLDFRCLQAAVGETPVWINPPDVYTPLFTASKSDVWLPPSPSLKMIFGLTNTSAVENEIVHIWSSKRVIVVPGQLPRYALPVLSSLINERAVEGGVTALSFNIRIRT